jgi:hypothetical protein
VRHQQAEVADGWAIVMAGGGTSWQDQAPPRIARFVGIGAAMQVANPKKWGKEMRPEWDAAPDEALPLSRHHHGAFLPHPHRIIAAAQDVAVGSAGRCVLTVQEAGLDENHRP